MGNNNLDLFGEPVNKKPLQPEIKNKDWTGSTSSIFKNIGASNHTSKNRQRHDFYATDPKATELLISLEKFSDKIWEPACGAGHMAEPLKLAGYNVYATDLFDRGYGIGDVNFLSPEITHFDGDIITNPPYKYAEQFVKKAISIIPTGNKVAMFLKLQFLESQGRQHLFENHPPYRVYVSRSRILCALNGEFEKQKNKLDGGAIAYCWYVWVKGFTGHPEIHWFN